MTFSSLLNILRFDKQKISTKKLLCLFFALLIPSLLSNIFIGDATKISLIEVIFQPLLFLFAIKILIENTKLKASYIIMGVVPLLNCLLFSFLLLLSGSFQIYKLIIYIIEPILLFTCVNIFLQKNRINTFVKLYFGYFFYFISSFIFTAIVQSLFYKKHLYIELTLFIYTLIGGLIFSIVFVLSYKIACVVFNIKSK